MEKYTDIPREEARLATVRVGPHSQAQGLLTRISISTTGKRFHTVDTNFYDEDNPVYVTGDLISPEE